MVKNDHFDLKQKMFFAMCEHNIKSKEKDRTERSRWHHKQMAKFYANKLQEIAENEMSEIKK